MPPAARLTDLHTCPMQTPGVPPIPHVGGPVVGPGCPTVLIGGMPAAVLGDSCVCVGPPDSIIKGSATVLIGGSGLFVLATLFFGTKGGYYDTDQYDGNGTAH